MSFRKSFTKIDHFQARRQTISFQTKCVPSKNLEIQAIKNNVKTNDADVIMNATENLASNETNKIIARVGKMTKNSDKDEIVSENNENNMDKRVSSLRVTQNMRSIIENEIYTIPDTHKAFLESTPSKNTCKAIRGDSRKYHPNTNNIQNTMQNNAQDCAKKGIKTTVQNIIQKSAQKTQDAVQDIVKERLKECGYKSSIAMLLSSLLVGFPIVANAQRIDLTNFFYRDFLDLGQNRGRFYAGSSNVTLDSIKNPGVSVTLPFEIPSFSARSENGNMTSIGRGFAATAWHVKSFDNCAQNPNICTWGQTTYNVMTHSESPYGKDSRFVRMDKFIVEGSMPLLDTDIVGKTGVTNTNKDNQEMRDKNEQALLKRLEAMQDENGNIYLLQAGQGLIRVQNGENNDRTGIFNEGHGIGSYWGMRSGSFGTVWRNENNDNKLFLMYESMNRNLSGQYGLAIRYDNNGVFSNEITQGDSGSGFYAYDAQKKQWYLMAVTSETNGRTSFLAQSDFDDYKKTFEQTIDLKNTTWNLTNKNLSQSSASQNLEDNKDVILQGGGTIDVKSDLTLNDSTKKQSGGLVFMANNGASAENPTTYTITQGSGNYKFNGAGLDIAENVKVNWNLGIYGALHKIGAGTLEITTYSSANNNSVSAPANNTYEMLRLGEGKVILNTDKKVFSNAYITSGRGTLELVQGKGEALGATKNSDNSYTLEQSKNNEMGFVFGNGGGNLDLKGNSFILNTISSNDANANIINSDSTQSIMTLQGYGYDSNGNKGNTAADTIIHASFGQNTNINSKALNANNNIKLVYKNDTRPMDSDGKSGAALVFDGNLDVKSLESSNGNIVLQGHPTTHGYVRVEGHFAEQQKQLIEQLKQAEGKYLPNWMDLTRPSTLEQPDWDYRIFNIDNIDLKNSNLSVGRAAIIQGNITADKDSSIKLGGQVKHYIDKLDGENTQVGGTNYKQEAEHGILSDESQLLANAQISYNGKITATGSTIESKIFDFNANLVLKSGAKLTADYLTLEERQGSTGEVASLSDSNTTASVKHILFKNISNTSKINVSNDAKFNIENSITLENSKINLASFDFSKIGNMLVDNNSNATLNNGQGSYNLIVSDKSSYHNTANDFTLSSGNQISISGESSVQIGSGAVNGTIKVDGTNTTNFALDSKTQNLENIADNTLQNTSTQTRCQNTQNSNACLPSDNVLDSSNKPDFSLQTIITVEKGSKLELANFKADNNANVYLALDVDTTKSLDSKLTSTQKNFNIEAGSNSNVYVNAWDFNREGYDSANKTTSLKTDDSSRIHFGTLSYDMAKTNYVGKPIEANLSIYNKLTLDNVGKVQAGTQTKQGDMAATYTKNITSDNVLNPMSQTFSQSDPLKLATQVGTSDDRFHALQLQGNDASTMSGGKNLTLENGTRIEVRLDSSVQKGDNSNGFQLNKYYTLISAGSITDNRSDKRIYFDFANGVTPLYWTTLVEDGEVKVKFSEFNPSSYEELSKVVSNDSLLQILIEHNPQNDFVQMAGTANQHAELEGFLENINKGMDSIEQSNSRSVSYNLLYANNEAINTRVAQVKVMQPIAAKKLAMNKVSAGNDTILSDADTGSFNDLKLMMDSIDEARKKNNMWINVGGGFFSQNSGGNLVFYGTNLGYDRIFTLGENEYLLGAMAGIGGSSYGATGAKDSSLFYNAGFYMSTDIVNTHELQSNMNFSYLDSNKTIEAQGSAPADSMRGGTFGWLWSVYYKYKFNFGAIGEFKQVMKPVAFINLGFNGIAALEGSFYKQKAYNDFNLALGAGGEYSLVKDNAIYSLQVLARQGVFSSGNQIFVSLSNANDFMAYDLRNVALGFQLNFIGYNQFDYDLSLQYGISSLFDIQWNYGVKGDVRLQYKF